MPNDAVVKALFIVAGVGITVRHQQPKISPIPNPSHSGRGDQIWTSLVRILLIVSGAVAIDSTPEMVFLGRIRIIFDSTNTLPASPTTGGAVGGAYMIDTLLHFPCVWAHFALNFYRISYTKVRHFSSQN